MFYRSVICVLVSTSLIAFTHGALYTYEEIDCSGPPVVHSETTGCVDLTSIMSNQVKGDDSKHGWLIYPTTDCSGPQNYISLPQNEADNKCISDNQSYRFIAQSARPNHPDDP